MSDKNSYAPYISRERFSEFFREEFPDLLEFVQQYYEFLDQRTEVAEIQRYFDLDALKVREFVFNTSSGAPTEAEQILSQRKAVTQQFDIIIDKYLKQYADGIPALFRSAITVTSGGTVERSMAFPGFAVDGETMGLETGLLDNAVMKFGRERIVTFLRNTTAIYTTKGTEDCLVFLFRFLFNTLVTVVYPKEQILRASESTWTVTSRIDVTVIGPTPEVDDVIRWRLTREDQSLTPEYLIVVRAVTAIGTNRYILEFDYSPIIELDGARLSGGYMTIDRPMGQQLLLTPTKTLAKLQVITPGKFWSVGKVFDIDSILPQGISTESIVTSITDLTGIKGIKILNYGSGQIGTNDVVLTPLRDIWFSGRSVLAIQEDPNTPGGRLLTLSVSENADCQIEESMVINGELSGGNISYYDSLYTQPVVPPEDALPYTWDAISSTGTLRQGGAAAVPSSVSYEDYIASQTILRPVYDWVANDAGRYQDSSGHLSDSYSVLQDNYMYQEFSYIVESNVTVQTAVTALGFNHPAGLKYFFNSARYDVVGLDSETVIDRALGKALFFDSASPEDSIAKVVTKPLVDSAVAEETSVKKKVTKPLVDQYDSSLLVTSTMVDSYYDLAAEYYVDNSYYIKYVKIATQ